jgi:hypothetical protein
MTYILLIGILLLGGPGGGGGGSVGGQSNIIPVAL